MPAIRHDSSVEARAAALGARLFLWLRTGARSVAGFSSTGLLASRAANRPAQKLRLVLHHVEPLTTTRSRLTHRGLCRLDDGLRLLDRNRCGGANGPIVLNWLNGFGAILRAFGAVLPLRALGSILAIRSLATILTLLPVPTVLTITSITLLAVATIETAVTEARILAAILAAILPTVVPAF